MFSKDENNENIVVVNDETTYEDFDEDDTMEKMLELFIFHRKNAKFMDWFSFLSFVVFFFVNVGCVTFNLYKAITVETDYANDVFGNGKAMINNDLYSRGLTNITSFFNSNSTSNNGVIMDKSTKILYVSEFSVIMLFLLLAIYNYIRLMFNPSSKSYLSNAANFTRLVREFSCFTLVPLFNVNTIMGIYNTIAVTFDEEKKKYADRSKLWDGIWGVGTKDVQKTSEDVELIIGNDGLNSDQNGNNNHNEEESWFKKFKHSKIFLGFVSVIIYIGFFLSIIALICLAFFAFVALYIKTRHVGNFITRRTDGFDIYKWFNFITFITNIASLSQHSPAIKLIIYELKILTKKAHINKYRRRKQNRIKENATKFDADKNQEGIQPPKIIIHRKRISRTQDDTDIDKIKDEEIDSDRLVPNSLKHHNSKLSLKSGNSI